MIEATAETAIIMDIWITTCSRMTMHNRPAISLIRVATLYRVHAWLRRLFGCNGCSGLRGSGSGSGRSGGCRGWCGRGGSSPFCSKQKYDMKKKEHFLMKRNMHGKSSNATPTRHDIKQSPRLDHVNIYYLFFVEDVSTNDARSRQSGT